MLSVASLRKRFDDRCRLRAVEVKAAITESGLVLGAGTLLVRMGKDRFGLPMLAFVQDGERVHTLLTVAQRRPPSADFYRHLQSAAEYWRRGDKALANLRLAFARLPQLESELDAWRLYLAAELLDEGSRPVACCENSATTLATCTNMIRTSRGSRRVPVEKAASGVPAKAARLYRVQVALAGLRLIPRAIWRRWARESRRRFSMRSAPMFSLA